MLVHVVERSGDAKLTNDFNVSATYVPQQSCHSDCPLYKNGCYAELGNVGIHTHRANHRAKALRMGLAKLRLLLARQEAEGIRTLTGKRKLRVHVVGDCATPTTAGIVGQAMVEHEQRKGKPAWTYTHSWRRILPKHWRGARVLASCETPEQVQHARQRGYATALVVPPHPSNKVYDYHGIKVVPCPAQFFWVDGRIVPGGTGHMPEGAKRVATCEDCNICQDVDMLKTRNLSVGFQPDGLTRKRVIRLIENGGRREQRGEST